MVAVTAGLLSPAAVELWSPYKPRAESGLLKYLQQLMNFATRMKCFHMGITAPGTSELNSVSQRYSEGLQGAFNKANSSWENSQAVEKDPVTTVM